MMNLLLVAALPKVWLWRFLNVCHRKTIVIPRLERSRS